MKKLLLLLLLFLVSCKDKLPYNLEITRGDYLYTVNDTTGCPVLQENYAMMELKKYGEIKHLISYSINKIGLVFKVSNDNSEILYVFVTPKKIQKYVELSVDYKVYYENEYKKLHLEDDWNSIRGY